MLKGEYETFDAPQICRHLMAIYRHKEMHQNEYEGKKIVLQSMSWIITDGMIEYASRIGMRGDILESIRTKFDDESQVFEKIINESIQQLKWKECLFECKHYNDELSMIFGSSKYNQIIIQYFK